MRSLRILLLALLVVAVSLPRPAQASGPFVFQTPFFDERNLEDLLAGNLTDRFSRRNLAPLISYLHLTGQFTPRHAALLREQGRERERQEKKSRPRPEREFEHLLETEGYRIFYYQTWKAVTRNHVKDGRPTTTRYFINNCQPDAFRVAARTFEERKSRYGSGSPQLKRWIEAQMRVFDHCGDASFNPPSEPQGEWESFEKHDRQYQIAASFFYDGQYPEAARRFREISNTPGSPWSGLSRYLVGRSLVREATVNEDKQLVLLNQALAEYRQLALDSNYLERFPWIVQQIEFIQAKVDPASVLNELERKIIHNPESVSDEDIRDYVFLISSDTRQRREGGAYADWYFLASAPGNMQETIERWREEQSLEWLFLALITAHSSAGQETLTDLLRAAGEYGPETPGYYVMLDHQVRIMALLGDAGGALALADNPYEAGTPLSRAHINRVRLRAAYLSDRWEDFFRFASMRPLELPWHYAMPNRNTTLFPREATERINAYFTPKMMLEAIEFQDLSNYQRSRLAISGWMKAMLLKDSVSAHRLSTEVKRYVPRLKAALEKLESGRDPEFEAALIVLSNPALAPGMWSGAGRVQGRDQSIGPALDNVALPLSGFNWWCSNYFARNQNEAELSGPRFAHFDEVQLEEIRQLKAVERISVAGFFGPAVLRYARSSLDDPRVPYALHRVVFASRHACMDGPGDIAKKAHNLLHKHFPDSEWAKKTPYWYE